MSHRTIATILPHDSKRTSYKIALLRALSDVVLAYPDVGRDGGDVAVPPRVARAVAGLIESIASARNLARF